MLRRLSVGPLAVNKRDGLNVFSHIVLVNGMAFILVDKNSTFVDEY